MQVPNSIENLSRGDHLCCMYMTEEEHREILTPFIISGLEQGDKVFYIVDVRTAETVLEYLEHAGLDTSKYLSSGQFVIADTRDTYIKDGSFDPDRMLSMLKSETDWAIENGFNALRVTGEMSWALRDLPGTERLMEYEAKLNQFFPSHKAIGLCQYDMRSFDAEVLLDVLATHPIAIVRNNCYDNMYYVPPEDFLGGTRAETELYHRIHNLEERQKIEEEREKYQEALRQSEANAKRRAEFIEAIFDNAGALIVLLDHNGYIKRFNRTCEEVTGYTAEEVLDRKIWDVIIPREEVEATRAVFNKLSCGQFPMRFENSWKTKQGGSVRVAWSNTCLLDTDNEVEMIVGTGLDITESSMVELARKREISCLEEYSDLTSTATTASSLGVVPLSQNNYQAFQGVVEELQEMLDQSMEQTVYKVSHNLSDKQRKLAERLGILRAGPRDVVQAYIQAIQERTKGQPKKMIRAYTDEGRLLLIELMGYLAAYYYNQSLGD